MVDIIRLRPIVGDVKEVAKYIVGAENIRKVAARLKGFI